MNIVFASQYPFDDMHGFSGVPYFMSRAIKDVAEAFEYVVTPPYELSTMIAGGEAERAQVKVCGKFLSDYLDHSDADVVICQGASMIPFLSTKKLVVLWHDSTWFSLMRTDFQNFKTRYPLLYEWDCKTLEKCDIVAFAADWLRDQAVSCYGIPERKVHVLPFGANLYPAPVGTVPKAISQRDLASCELTFLGIDWQRKGLSLAYEVMRKLNAKGLRTRLTTIGCEIPPIRRKHRLEHAFRIRHFSDIEQFQSDFIHDPNVRRIGILHKDDPHDYDELCQILSNTHFLLHPAEFEPFGIALVEANAFGVPVLAAADHGPATIIRNGINGNLFKRDDYVESATEFILRLMNDPDGYRSLALSSLAEYRDRLNWTTSARKLKEIIDNMRKQ